MAKVRKGGLTRTLVLGYGSLVPFIIFALFPIYFMFLTSFRAEIELYDLGAAPFVFNQSPTLEHYIYIFSAFLPVCWISSFLTIYFVISF